MAQTTINVRIDEKTKNDFEKFCNETGLNISTAINLFIKTVIRENQIPFKITTDPFYNKDNIDYLKEVINDIETNKSKLKEHKIIKEEE